MKDKNQTNLKKTSKKNTIFDTLKINLRTSTKVLDLTKYPKITVTNKDK